MFNRYTNLSIYDSVGSPLMWKTCNAPQVAIHTHINTPCHHMCQSYGVWWLIYALFISTRHHLSKHLKHASERVMNSPNGSCKVLCYAISSDQLFCLNIERRKTTTASSCDLVCRCTSVHSHMHVNIEFIKYHRSADPCKQHLTAMTTSIDYMVVRE